MISFVVPLVNLATDQTTRGFRSPHTGGRRLLVRPLVSSSQSEEQSRVRSTYLESPLDSRSTLSDRSNSRRTRRLFAETRSSIASASIKGEGYFREREREREREGEREGESYFQWHVYGPLTLGECAVYSLHDDYLWHSGRCLPVIRLHLSHNISR